MERVRHIFVNGTSKLKAFAKNAASKAAPHKKPLGIGSAIVLAVAGGTLIMLAGGTAAITKDDPSRMSSEEYQRELRDAVDTEAGQPRDGRDPASQSQNSLANAASQPDGPGQRTDSPASGVEGDHSHHHGMDNQEGVTSAGCIVGYGKPGEQCLPTTGNDHTITCSYVHQKGFHSGLAVTGSDQYNLDKNDDGTACGAGD